MATYAYFIENISNSNYLDNSPLFKYIQTIELEQDCIHIEKPQERIEIKQLFKKLQPEDILIVRSIQDLGDNITQILRVLIWLIEQSVDLISLQEDYYDCKIYKNLLIDLLRFDTYLKETARISGFEAAKEAGRVGRPRNNKVQEAIKLYESKKFTNVQIQEMTSVSPSTLYRAIRDRQVKINCD